MKCARSLHFVPLDLFMFVEKSDICNFTDNNALYKSSPSLSVVLNCLEHDITMVLNWFIVSSLKANPQKFQFMVLGGKKSFQYKWKVEDTYIFSKDKVVLLGITIDKKLTFEAHIENLRKKVSYKLWALQRIRKLHTTIRAKTMASSFVNSQFNYCAIVWMFYSRKLKLRLENVHKENINTKKTTRTFLKLVFIRSIYSFLRLKSSNRQYWIHSSCGAFLRTIRFHTI